MYSGTYICSRKRNVKLASRKLISPTKKSKDLKSKQSVLTKSLTSFTAADTLRPHESLLLFCGQRALGGPSFDTSCSSDHKPLPSPETHPGSTVIPEPVITPFTQAIYWPACRSTLFSQKPLLYNHPSPNALVLRILNVDIQMKLGGVPPAYSGGPQGQVNKRCVGCWILENPTSFTKLIENPHCMLS